MNKESAIVYTIAAVGGAAWFWFSSSVGEAVIAAFATLGAEVIVWHIFDTVDNAARKHYESKNVRG